jgi:hypothetical protein
MQDFFQKNSENCPFYGLDSGYGPGTRTGIITCQKSEPEPEKIGTVIA